MTTLLQTLPEQPLAVVGDIHGESKALDDLLGHLDRQPDAGKRLLVFIGDLCDRGPDSVGVINRVQALVDQGRALAILGNHEIDLLANDAKDGSGWFFDSRQQADARYYAPFVRASAAQRPAIREFLCSLPLAIQMPGLRIVHAAWDPPSIAAIAEAPCGSILELIHSWRQYVVREAQKDNLHARYRAELDRWAGQLENRDDPPPYLDAVADYESLEHRLDPIKRLTSGIESRSPHPFFSGNRWRYSDRTAWWLDDPDPTPVLIGHYWRLFQPADSMNAWRYSMLFKDVAPTEWHGQHHQAFCLDYSVGARWRDRKDHSGSVIPTHFRLAAMNWPERTLLFDNGEQCKTTVPAAC